MTDFEYKESESYLKIHVLLSRTQSVEKPIFHHPAIK